MKNKLTKSDIKFIADKFEWSEKQAKKAVKGLLEKSSFANIEEILRICIDAKNPNERKRKIFQCLVNTHCEDLAKHVCNQIIHPDHCFHIIAFFIMVEEGLPLYFFGKRLNKGTYPESFYLKTKTHNVIKLNPGYFYDLVDSICYEYLDMLLKSKFRQGLNSESLLLDIVSRVGFRAFNIDILKDKAVMYSSSPFYNSKATRLARAIASPLDKKELTQIAYWLNYVIIERNRDKYGVRGALRKLEKITGQKYNSIQPRYWERKKIAKEEGLTLDYIVTKYALHKYIEDIEQQF